MVSEIITKNSEETKKIGETFAKSLLASQGETLQEERPDKALVIALFGELGSGKTTFTQGFAKGLGIKKRIISPTFIVLRTYKIKIQNSKGKITNQNAKVFYHIDLYRLGNKKDIGELGISEIMNDSQNIVVIEWAEKMGELLPREKVDIYFEYIDEEKRKIAIKNHKHQITNHK